MSSLDVLLYLGAVVRLTRMATADRIPLGALRTKVLALGRTRTRREVIPNVGTVEIQPAWAELWACEACMSVWVALGYAPAYWAWPTVMFWPSLALSGSLMAIAVPLLLRQTR